MPYAAPSDTLIHTLNAIAGFGDAETLRQYPDFDPDLVAPILEEAGKLASEVLSPLNSVGHQHGARLVDGDVKSAPGFAEAYAQYRDGGWAGLSAPTRFGGQGLPRPLALAVMEMLNAANTSFALCPILTSGAVEALIAHGSDEQQATYLPKMISGEWTGAMDLTEPQAGSDVGALKTKAIPNGDGSYAISGQKIFITWGDHDMADNIIHLVLARLPDAPEGSRGISLFVAPKFLVNADGSLGARNNFRCIGLENKMGIHASPTCVMEFDGATGWLVGAPNKGLAAMFTMMNAARLNVGLQGVGVSEGALQAATAYAKERRQGPAPGIEGPVPIIRHPDIQRMLMTMAANTQAARAICYACAAAADAALYAPEEAARAAARMREDLLTPIAKAWSTDRAVETASLGVQINGGMGFMNETDAAQFFLDARITPIYEGTNGIQAMDLVGRKLAANQGVGMEALLNGMRDTMHAAAASDAPHMFQISDRLGASIAAMEEASDWMIHAMNTDRELALSGATAYLRLAGETTAGYYLTLSALKADAPQRQQAILLARYFAEETLSLAPARLAGITTAAAILRDASTAVFGTIDS